MPVSWQFILSLGLNVGPKGKDYERFINIILVNYLYRLLPT